MLANMETRRGAGLAPAERIVRRRRAPLVLLVIGDAPARRVLAEKLEDVGLSVFAVGSAAAGLDFAARRAPDLAVVDLVIADALEAVRALELASTKTVVLLEGDRAADVYEGARLVARDDLPGLLSALAHAYRSRPRDRASREHLGEGARASMLG